MNCSHITLPSITRQRPEKRKIKLLQYANKKRLIGKFNDVTIQVEEQSISANRMVLSCSSKFFESMFLSPFIEQRQETIVLQGLDGDSVKELIEYMYSGRIEISDNNVMFLLSTADFLQIDTVRKFCFDFFETALTIETCIEFFKASVMYNNSSNLRQICLFSSDNLDFILNQESFLNLSKELLIFLIDNLNRGKLPEVSLYNAILSWVQYDKSRNTEFTELFMMLDLDRFQPEFVENVIVEEPLAKQCRKCLNRLVSYFVSNAKETRKLESESKILCVGGLDIKSVSEVYNVLGNSTSTYPDLLGNVERYSSLLDNNFLYCIGGAIDNDVGKLSNKMHRMNLQDSTSKWEEMAPMMEKRCDFGAAVYEGCIVVAGGFNGDSRTNTVEAYDLQSNQWRKLSSLNHCRDELHLVTAGKNSGNGLFAIGSNIYGCSENSVERLNILNGFWKEVKPMDTARRCFTAVSCNRFIYVIGGFPKEALETVEKYDPVYNRWSYTSNLNAGRWRHASCAFQGKIFVVGGEKFGRAERKIECYDPVLDQWSIIDVAKQEVYDHNLVSL